MSINLAALITCVRPTLVQAPTGSMGLQDTSSNQVGRGILDNQDMQKQLQRETKCV